MTKQTSSSSLTLTFVGTGSVFATPVLGCDCPACRRALNDSKYERFPASLLIKTIASTVSDIKSVDNNTASTTVLIDAGHPRLEQLVRQQAIDTILLTHFHPDHVQGLFGLRWGMPNLTINVIAPNDPIGCADLFKNPGVLNFEQKTTAFTPFALGDLNITPLPMRHSKLTHGYLIKHASLTFAYLTDTQGLDDAVIRFINHQNPTLCIIDCTYAPTEAPNNHNNLTLVQALQDQLNQVPMLMTHIGHGMDAWYMTHHHQCSERGIEMAVDALRLTFKAPLNLSI